jgi:acetyltransferase-like isoleucine patch superfamily enzyme
MYALAYFLRGLNSITRRLAIYIRITWLRLLYPGLHIDFGSTIESNCNIKCVKGGKLKINQSTILSGTQIISDASASIIIDRSFIGRNCVIASKKSIHIHKGCLVAEMVVIRDQNHSMDITEDTQERDGFSCDPIVIEENVWIAAKATILKGVKIGESSIVAASSVINKSIPASEVWGGIPGKFLKDLKKATV